MDYISIDVDSTDVWLMHALLSGGYAPRVLSIEFNARRCAPVYSSTLYFPLDRATSRLNHASQVPDDGINGLVPPDDVHDWNLLWRSLTAGGFWRSNLSSLSRISLHLAASVCCRCASVSFFLLFFRFSSGSSSSCFCSSSSFSSRRTPRFDRRITLSMM